MRPLAVPKVVALCGPGKAGSYGLASLRHLASQGVRTCAYLPTFPMYPAMVDAELNLYKLCLKKQEHVLVHDAAKDLPVKSKTPAKPEPFLFATESHHVNHTPYLPSKLYCCLICNSALCFAKSFEFSKLFLRLGHKIRKILKKFVKQWIH